MSIPTITLSNGLALPAIGFGTYKLTGEAGIAAMTNALKAGWRLLDTASFYGNEEEIGEAVRRSGLPREEVLLTTKAWRTELGYDRVLRAFDDSCRRLGTDYLDLYLLHWPEVPGRDPDYLRVNAESWRALEELYAAGRVRAIGVSNYLDSQLKPLLDGCTVVPMVDQLEYHPGWTQRETVSFCRANGITVEAWSPLGRGRVLSEPLLLQLAEQYHCSVGVLCLAFAMRNGVLPIPKTASAARAAENLTAAELPLTEEDAARIEALPAFGWSGEDPLTQDVINT